MRKNGIKISFLNLSPSKNVRGRFEENVSVNLESERRELALKLNEMMP